MVLPAGHCELGTGLLTVQEVACVQGRIRGAVFCVQGAPRAASIMMGPPCMQVAVVLQGAGNRLA